MISPLGFYNLYPFWVFEIQNQFQNKKQIGPTGVVEVECADYKSDQIIN